MPATSSVPASARKPLRLWPGVALVVAGWLGPLVLPWVVPAVADFHVLVWVGAGLAVFAWWLLFSRAPWLERIGAVAVMVVAVFATRPFLHASIVGGSMGVLPFLLSIPSLTLALVVWAAAARRLNGVSRWVAMIACVAIGAGGWALARTDGVRSGGFDLRWRWTPTAEEQLLAGAPADPGPAAPAGAARVVTPPEPPRVSTETAPAPAAPVPPTPTAAGAHAASASPTVPSAEVARPEAPAPVRAKPADWPGFRGPNRDSVVPGLRIDTDWAASPPVELWRRPIGPGWSSFAVDGDRLYTQEQRGNDEIVACYDARTGEPAWLHRDAARFWESNGGAGPRATPTLAHGRVYAQGATGILNALDARDGRVIWSRNAVKDTGARIPYWGIAGSPLVAGDQVVVAVSGRLIAYDAANGTPRWRGPDGGGSYSSPHLVTIGGVRQVVLQHADGATAVALESGQRLWTQPFEGGAIVQPAVTREGDVLISTNSATGGNGIRRVALTTEGAAWRPRELWTSSGLKPYFNDFVLHEGHAYGFDGSILSCIDLADGTRKWKGGRFGNGQLVLLGDQGVLLVLSEEGELALVQAAPDRFTQLARVRALEGKTWNHPVVVGDVLYVRNGEEMAAFRLTLDSR